MISTIFGRDARLAEDKRDGMSEAATEPASTLRMNCLRVIVLLMVLTSPSENRATLRRCHILLVLQWPCLFVRAHPRQNPGCASDNAWMFGCHIVFLTNIRTQIIELNRR